LLTSTWAYLLSGTVLLIGLEIWEPSLNRMTVKWWSLVACMRWWRFEHSSQYNSLQVTHKLMTSFLESHILQFIPIFVRGKSDSSGIRPRRMSVFVAFCLVWAVEQAAQYHWSHVTQYVVKNSVFSPHPSHFSISVVFAKNYTIQS
jgi:hypothetical protein